MQHIVLASALNVRSEPTTSASTQSVLARYAAVEEIDATQDRDWLKIAAPGHRGWCRSTFLLAADLWRAPLGYVIAAEFGVGEVAGPASNPRINEYQKSLPGAPLDDEVAWCSSFMHWSVQKVRGAVKPLKGITPAARSWKSWGDAEPDQANPAPGCIAVLWRKHPDKDAGKSVDKVVKDGLYGHVAMLAEPYNVGDKVINLLGGNQGGRVSKSSYRIDGTQHGVLSFRRLP